MRKKFQRLLLSMVLCLISGSVFAHPGHAEAGLTAGLLHPLSGVDHWLAMLAVGLWAGRSGGSARWQLPLAFLGAMSAGWFAGLSGWAIPGMESAIAASVLAPGLALALRTEIPRAAQLALVALFAVFHGAAHGMELPATAPLATALGFLISTAALHGAGLGMAQLLARRVALYRLTGMGIALAGTALLLQ